MFIESERKNCYIKLLYAYRHTIQICVAISIVYVIVSITCKLQIDRNIYKINKLKSVKRGE